MTMGRIERYIAEQPAVLAAVARDLPPRLALWKPASFEGIVLVGTGSSLNALTVAEPMMAQAGRGPVRLRGPIPFQRELEAGAAGHPLVIVVSQSGNSLTVIDAAAAARRANLPTLVMTAHADSPIGRVGAPLAVLPIGEETVGPKTKGYTASVAGLLALAQRLGARLPEPVDLAAAMQAGLGPARAAAWALARALADVDMILVTGQGRHYGTALEASLKIAEMAGVPTAAFDTEEALHGRFHGLTARSFTLLIAADSEERASAERAAAVMADHGTTVRLLNLTPVATSYDWRVPAGLLPPPYDPLSAILPCQYLGCALAEGRGRDPDVMRYPGLSARLNIKARDEP
jgi:fructoselysine-6-P-deglycase FrlB-like protein